MIHDGGWCTLVGWRRYCLLLYILYTYTEKHAYEY